MKVGNAFGLDIFCVFHGIRQIKSVHNVLSLSTSEVLSVHWPGLRLKGLLQIMPSSGVNVPDGLNSKGVSRASSVVRPRRAAQ